MVLQRLRRDILEAVEQEEQLDERWYHGDLHGLGSAGNSARTRYAFMKHLSDGKQLVR